MMTVNESLDLVLIDRPPRCQDEIEYGENTDIYLHEIHFHRRYTNIAASLIE